MNHNEAVQSQACERYVLGELSPELRDAYEEHYFSCALCADELRSTAEVLGGSRQILAETPEPAGARRQGERLRNGWFGWLKPVVVIPAFSALLLIVGYQNLVTIPRYKQSASSRVLPMYSLISANTRGGEGHTFSVAPEQPFGLYVDVPVDPAYSVYLVHVESPSGESSPLRSLTAKDAQKTQVITVNPGRHAGTYTIVVSGLANSSAKNSTTTELARLQFTVEFKN